MVKKIGNFFKKSENDWLKVTVSLVVSIVMILFFSKTLLVSYSIPDTLPDTLTSGQNDPTDRVNLFPSLDGEEIIGLNSFYATDSSGVQYVVYCLEKEKGWSVGQTITRNDEPLDPGYIYIIQNGYPAKSLTGNNENDEYLTRIAVWWYQDRSNGVSDSEDGVLTANQKSVIKASPYYSSLGPLIEGAVNAKENPVVINPTFSINSSSFHLSSDNTYLITDTINVISNVSFESYQVSVNNAAVQVLDGNNSPITGTINSGSGFKLRVNLADLDKPVNVTVSVTVNYSEYEAYSYSPPSDMVNMQESFAAGIVPVAKQKTVSTNVSMPTGSLTIRKVDSTNNSALAGANIEVRRVINNEVVANFTTTTSNYTVSDLLPGEYKITELSAPAGYYASSSNSSSVVISTDNLHPSETISNTPYDVKIRKVDSTTGEAVAGAVLRVLNSSNSEVYRFTSTTSYVSIPNLTEGTYTVEEVSAPPGYVLSTETERFTINRDNPNVTVDFENEPNEIIIEKRDASSNAFVSGATLRLVRASDNAVIDEWTTGSSGHVIRGLLPGNYKVIETKAPSGYTLSNSEVDVTVTNSQSEPLTVTFYNTKNEISIVKVDSETGKIVSGATLKVTNSSGDEVDTFITEDTPHVLSFLSPGTYYVEETNNPEGYVLDSNRVSFVVNEDTSNLQVEFKNKRNEVRLGKVDEDGNYIAGATLRLSNSDGEEIETFTSGSIPHVRRGLASGTYTLEEVEAPNGYIRNTKPVPFTIRDTDDVVTYTISNKKTKVTISKVDSESGEFVSGVTLGIYDSKDSDEPVKSFTTTDTPTVISDLNEGTYYVREIRAASGYVLDKTFHEFTLDNDTPEVNITIKNEPITLNLGKIDANTGEYIAGATMQLNREDGNMEPKTFISTNEPYVVTKIPAGIYSLSEIEAPEGYISSNSKVVFEVLETGEVQTINISNDVITITVDGRKIEIDSKGVSGYKFNLIDSEDNIIEEVTTTEDIYVSQELELGDYRLVETAVPDGVVLNSNAYYFSVTDSNTVSVVNFVNDFTKVMISKKDMANSEEVEGAHLVVRNSDGEIVEEWTSTDTPHYIEKLPSGHYSLTETIAPDGYVLNTSTVEFDILPNGEIQSTVMFNSKPIDVPNTSSNATYIYLIGGILVVIGGSVMYISRRNKSFKKSR